MMCQTKAGVALHLQPKFISKRKHQALEIPYPEAQEAWMSVTGQHRKTSWEKRKRQGCMYFLDT